jgi:hypothetical protein
MADGASTNIDTRIYAGNRVVGLVRGGEFIKRVKGSRHFLRRPPSICFDVSSLEEARNAGASTVKVIDDESGQVYQVPISLIFAKGFIFNRGHGEQIGLVFRYWQTGDDPLARQLELWS